jgi:AGZA family xanthine/uracil permease-like MFS transporter
VLADIFEKFYGIRQKGSSVSTEVLAGVSTFLSLSYIFVVNPAILAQAGMDKSFVLFATIVTSALGTLAMGLAARLPFVLAPGMEMNAYVAFFVVGALGFTWHEALGAVFWSGIIFVVLTITHVRHRIIDAIPERMKSALSLSVGVFLWLVALKIAGMLRYEDVRIKGIGDLTSPLACAFYVSLVLVLVMDRLKVRAAVLISITATAILCHVLHIGVDLERPTNLSSTMLSGVGQLAVGVIANPKAFSVILILFLVDFYGSVAKFIGLSMNTTILVGGTLPRLKEALLVDGISTVFGSAMGTTSITTYVESGVGIGVGGRTGLTAVVCGLLMLSCFFLTPLLRFVPVVATTGALALVGIKLCPPMREFRFYSRMDLFVLVLMQAMVVTTFAIDRAMLAGFAAHIAANVLSGRRPNLYLVGSTALLAVGAVLQAR